jgi:integrase
MTRRRSVVNIYVRHQGDCKYVNRSGRAFARDCQCVKWLRYSGEDCLCGHKHTGRQHRISADTRTWGTAEEKRAALQQRLDTGESTAPLPELKRQTIAQHLETHITAKESEGCSPATIRKLRNQLGDLERFLAERSKFFPADITATDLIEFRAEWTWGSGVTRQKAQQNVRAFLRSCCTNNLPGLLSALKTIRLSKTDITRLEPQPFSEEELTKLLAQVPVTFAQYPDKVARMTTLIKFMVSTGLAIRDTVQLERDNLAGGWLRIKRQKTNKPVEQKLDPGLHAELLKVSNGNPRYVFWNGTSRPTSATGLWQADLRDVMKPAGLWIKGNLSHRFRDTAVDFWLGSGCSILEVSAMLGDTVSIVEKHYRKLLSKRMADRLANVPTRSWAPVVTV